jgi:hypothetical protein
LEYAQLAQLLFHYLATGSSRLAIRVVLAITATSKAIALSLCELLVVARRAHVLVIEDIKLGILLVFHLLVEGSKLTN